MKSLNFRYYPPRLLTLLIIILLIIYFSLKAYFSHLPFSDILKTDALLFSGSAVLVLVLSLIATKIQHKYLFKTLDLPFIDGNYQGVLISSFKVDDNPNNENETRKYECIINQTLNGFSITGKISNKGIVSSTFSSTWTDIIRNEDGSFLLVFIYQNIPEQVLSIDKKSFQLDTHKGFCQLAVSLDEKSLEGHYFNYERESKGKIILTKK